MWHAIDDLPDIAKQTLEGLKPYCPALDWTRYCCRLEDLPHAGKKTDVCGHLAEVHSRGSGEIWAYLMFLHEGKTTLEFSKRSDWLACRPTGDITAPIFVTNLRVEINDWGRKNLLWVSGESEVVGGADE